MKSSGPRRRRSIVDRCVALENESATDRLFAVDAFGIPDCALVRFAAVINSRPVLRRHVAELAPFPTAVQSDGPAERAVDLRSRRWSGRSSPRDLRKTVHAARSVELPVE